jgi:membrane protease YdiL (CAAX protease family)
LNIIIASFFSNIIGLFGYEGVPTYATYTAKTTDVEFVVSFILIAVLPAICEETVHRGLLLGGFSRLGLKRAVLLSSLCFGLLHLNINQFFYATVIGFLMAIAVIITKSIIPAMIMHFCNNGLSCYLAFAGERQLFGSKIMDNFSTFISGSNAFTAFLGSFAIMAILVILIALFYIVLLRETRTKKMKTLLKQVSKIEQSKQLREKVSYINPNVNPFSNTYMNNLEQINSLLIQYNITSEKELIFKKEEKTYHKPTIMERVFVISSIFLLALVTIFTFVWGIL